MSLLQTCKGAIPSLWLCEPRVSAFWRLNFLFLVRRAGLNLSDMSVTVYFYSYFKELTGCATTAEEVAPGGTLAELQQQLGARFPKLAAMQNSTLIAVGVDYQPKTYALQEGDEVSLFPPVQGG